MRPRGWALLVVLVIAAGFGGYALRGGTGTPAAAGGAGGAAPGGAFPGGGRGGPGGFSRGGSAGSRGTGATVEVKAVTVKTGPLVADRSATGVVAAVTQSHVAAQASGTVKTLLVGAGDDVQANQPMLQLETGTLELALANAKTSLSTAEINLRTQQTNTEQAVAQLNHQLESARSALTAAEANFASAQKVYALGGASKASVDGAKSQLDQARANVSTAQNNLSQNQRAETGSIQQLRLAVSQAQNGVKQADMNLANATIRAPFAGQVTAFDVAPGEYVGPSTAVATVVGAQRQVQMSVPPSDAGAFAADTQLTFDTGVEQFPITVTQRPGVPVNQGVMVTARFGATASPGAPASSSDASAAGETAGVAATAARHPGPPAIGVVGTVAYRVTLATATLVPIGAIQNDGTNTFVFLIEGGKAVQTNVTILAQAGSDAAVSGVPSGSTVIDQPPPGLLDGSEVTTAAGAGSGRGAQGGSAPNGAAPSARRSFSAAGASGSATPPAGGGR